MAIKILQVHKRSSYEYKYIQDKYSYDLKNDCCAIADGTTQSFRSEEWAKLLTEDFCSKPIFDAKSLLKNFSTLAVAFQKRQHSFSDNPAKALLEAAKLKRGATATFIGVQKIADVLSVVTLGDSNIFICRNGTIIPFPFENVKQLDSNTTFLNTEKLVSSSIDVESVKTTLITLLPNDVIILATDALSRFLLKSPEYFEKLISIASFNELLKFCAEHWEGKMMEEDDITAAIISNWDLKQSIEIIPPADFSFPKEEEREFTPTPAIYSKELNYFDMQLSNIVYETSSELSRLKRKARLIEISLLIIFPLLAFIIFYLYSANLTTATNSPNQQRLIQETTDLKARLKESQSQINTLRSDILAIKKELSSTQIKSMVTEQSIKSVKTLAPSIIEKSSEKNSPLKISTPANQSSKTNINE